MADAGKTRKEDDPGGGYVVPQEFLDPGPEVRKLAASVHSAEEVPAPPLDPLACPTCGATLAVQRHTPDFATHYTVVCPACGYREKRAD